MKSVMVRKLNINSIKIILWHFQDSLNDKLRTAEESEKQAIDLEEESKLKLDECLGRESQAFEDLQKLKVGTCNRWIKMRFCTSIWETIL